MKHKKNNYNPGNRKGNFADTPTGEYKPSGWSDRLPKANREMYGPGDVLEAD